jgi:hypothetical protein
MDAGGRATHGAVAKHLTRSHALRGNADEGMTRGVLDRRNHVRHSHAERGNEENEETRKIHN